MYKQQLMVDSSNFNASLRSHELFRSKSEQLLLAQKKRLARFQGNIVEPWTPPKFDASQRFHELSRSRLSILSRFVAKFGQKYGSFWEKLSFVKIRFQLF